MQLNLFVLKLPDTLFIDLKSICLSPEIPVSKVPDSKAFTVIMKQSFPLNIRKVLSIGDKTSANINHIEL